MSLSFLGVLKGGIHLTDNYSEELSWSRHPGGAGGCRAEGGGAGEDSDSLSRKHWASAPLRRTAPDKGRKCIFAHGSINHVLSVRGCCSDNFYVCI